MVLYLLKFNNYYNRIVKKYNTISEYTTNGVLIATYQGITNWNPNDGISTKQIINHQGEIPDYVLAVENNVINSRWFVIEAKRTRAQQFEIELYRDVIADWYDDIVGAPVFIEKATLPSGSPLIFNKENMSYNQIKTSETPLKDRTKIPWIVGYCDKDWTTTINIPGEINVQPDYELNSLANYIYYYTESSPAMVETGDKNFRLNVYQAVSSLLGAYKQYFYLWDENGKATTSYFPFKGSSSIYKYYENNTTNIGYKSGSKFTASDNENILKHALQNIVWSQFSSADYISNLKTSSFAATLEAEDGKIIKANNAYYRIKFKRGDGSYAKATVSASSGLGGKFTEVVNTLISNNILTSTKTDPCFEYAVGTATYYFEFEQIITENISLEISASRKHSNFPYDIFAIPYGGITFADSKGTGSAYWANKLISEIIRVGGGGGSTSTHVYDVQLLPYCPIAQSRITEASRLSYITLEEGDGLLKKEGNTFGYSAVLWVENPDFSLTITAPDNPDLKFPENNIDVKIASETDVHRLVSPNYNGTFEFSVVQNGGVSSFDIDCSYKPFQPYIKISPHFSNLYGSDFNDARGLICGGDFSLTQIRDEWQSYQITNKNYNEIFNREIQSMKTQNEVQRAMEWINAFTGALGGGVNAGMMASMVGLGTGVGAGLIGGAVSLGAGIADIALSEKLRTEALNYKTDMYGYQLGNIQALPSSLTKVSSFNPNNKIFPIIEYYTATDTEKEALKEKLKYNGMTTMAIGTIGEYIGDTPQYIKGKLIRLETINDDFHVVNVISDEIYKGVFI